MLNWSSSGLQWRSCKEFGHVWINFRNGSVLQLGEKQLFPCHWARQCPVMTHSLNQTGEEKLQAIFIPVISVLSEFKAGSCCGHIKQDQNCPTGNLFFCFCSTCRETEVPLDMDQIEDVLDVLIKIKMSQISDCTSQVCSSAWTNSERMPLPVSSCSAPTTTAASLASGSSEARNWPSL